MSLAVRKRPNGRIPEPSQYTLGARSTKAMNSGEECADVTGLRAACKEIQGCTGSAELESDTVEYGEGKNNIN